MSYDFATSPVCEDKKLLIEITGIQHGEEQDLEFYDITDMSQQFSLEAKKKVDPELEDTTIYSWDWAEETENRNVWLKVEAEAEPIKLPLFQNVTSTTRRESDQDYLVQSILPLTLLPSFDESLTELERVAPVRAGYIYVFYNDKAWREIKITPEDNGMMTLKDINLYSYRQSRYGPFESGERIATGNALKELWIPVKDNGNHVNVRLAYSEVQWSAARLNYLEENKQELNRRVFGFSRLTIHGSSSILNANALPELRVREPELELFLSEPTKLNRDLSGEYLESTYQLIKDEISSENEDGDDAVHIFKSIKSYQYEYGMKQAALKEIITSDSSISEIWKTGQSADFLLDAKQRKLRVIILDDILFDYRNHSYLTMYGIGYLQQIYVDMSNQDYYSSAELVQKFVMKEKFGEQENPFYDYKDDINNYLGGRFHRTLRTIERKECCRDLKAVQGLVNKLINNSRLATVIRDISSLDDINSSAAHVIIGYGITALSYNVDLLDQMSNPDGSKQPPYLNTVRSIISEGSSHDLHNILFPPRGSITLEQEYTAPEPYNSGSGLASPESLALWSKENFAIEDDNIQLIDLGFMSSSNSNEEKPFNLERRIANITDGIFKGYYDALMELSRSSLENEAKVIQFNAAYAPVLTLLKATNDKFWGEMTYIPVGGAELTGTVVGVHGHGLSYGLTADEREHIKNRQNKAPMGRMYDQNGKLIASPGKNSFKVGQSISSLKSGVGPKLPLKVVVVPDDSKVIESLSKPNTHRVLQDIEQQGLNVSNTYEKLRVPYFIVVVEIINLKNNFHYINDVMGLNDTAYSFSNAASATVDLAIALTHASNLYTQNASRLATISNKPFITISDNVASKMTFLNSSSKLVSEISRLQIITIGAGFLTVAIASWDAFRLWQGNDRDSSVAMGMVAVGTLATTVATGFFTTSTPILFGMGPVAWFGIGLSLAGFALYMLWKDTPMEVWLKNGPFGREPAEKYTHLQDPQTAFERFVGLIFTTTVKGYRLGSQTGFPELVTSRMQRLGATHVIHVNTNLASLLNISTMDIECFVRQAVKKSIETRSRTGINTSDEIINLDENNLSIIYKERTEEGCAYFVKYDLSIPEFDTDFSWIMMRSYEYRYQPIFSVRTKFSVEGRVFPTPSLDNPNYNSASSELPSFDSETDSDQGWIKSIIFA